MQSEKFVEIDFERSRKTFKKVLDKRNKLW